MVSEIPPILLQVESLVCQSQSGSAAEMQDYYNYWNQQIYDTVLRCLLHFLIDTLLECNCNLNCNLNLDQDHAGAF